MFGHTQNSGFTLEKVLAKSKNCLKKAKVICTIGPASSNPEKLTQMLEAGMDVARLNFSHGSHEVRAADRRRTKPRSTSCGKPSERTRAGPAR